MASVDRRLCRAEQRAAWVAGLGGFGQTFVTGVAVVGALLVGARQVTTGELSVVHLAVVVLVPLALHEVLSTAPAAAVAWRGSKAALARVREVLTAPAVGTPDRLGSTAGEGSPAIELDALAAGWPGADPAVTGLDVRVHAGEMVALTGPSGSGKSTVAATVVGLLAPVSGTVRVAGRLGYLAQDAYLFDTTVAENVRLGRSDAPDRLVTDVLARVMVPLPLDRQVGRHGDDVSGGEARRIAVSRLLVGAANVLILDEPTEHLDAPTAAALVDDLWAVADASGAAVLVITHDPMVAARCDRVLDLASPLTCTRASTVHSGRA